MNHIYFSWCQNNNYLCNNYLCFEGQTVINGEIYSVGGYDNINNKYLRRWGLLLTCMCFLNWLQVHSLCTAFAFKFQFSSNNRTWFSVHKFTEWLCTNNWFLIHNIHNIHSKQYYSVLAITTPSRSILVCKYFSVGHYSNINDNIMPYYSLCSHNNTIKNLPTPVLLTVSLWQHQQKAVLLVFSHNKTIQKYFSMPVLLSVSLWQHQQKAMLLVLSHNNNPEVF